MQLKQTTDYSIRVLLYLAARRGRAPVPGNEIARETGISPTYFTKMTANLREKGLIRSDQGARGGFFLSKPPDQTTLYQIIIACEGTVTLNRCLEDPAACSRDATAWCKVRRHLSRIQTDMERELKSVTLADLI